jgi:hypothetical protein
MAHAVVHHFASGTKEQYKASRAAVHPAEGLPDGQLFHMAGMAEQGWTIVAVHDSKESWENFRDNTLMPRMQAGIEGGFTEPPTSYEFEISHLERSHNHTVIRSYSGEGATELFDALEQRENDVRKIIASVPGFVSYTAFRTGAGGMTVTVCEDKAGTDESSRRAAAWVQDNVPVAVGAPTITEGDSLLDF